MNSRRGWTRRLESPVERDFDDAAACVFAVPGSEERARAPFWNDRMARLPDSCVEVADQAPTEIGLALPSGTETLSLRDPEGLQRLFLGRRVAYLDISGLAHHVWAPLLRAGLSCLEELWVVYAEPERYRAHSSPASASLFDLSTSFGGVAPLPGFANLRGPRDPARAVFVALLGFEGTRARQVAMTLDPTPKVCPIVGLPGFRLEYPFVTVTCNQEFLDDHRAHGNVRFARASCPFEAYRVLEEIRADNPDAYMYIAPVGTKPHSLGAMWFAIENPVATEIMYDHPQRRPKRTWGVGVVHAYCLKDSAQAPT